MLRADLLFTLKIQEVCKFIKYTLIQFHLMKVYIGHLIFQMPKNKFKMLKKLV
jgi:hypothetical protein